MEYFLDTMKVSPDRQLDEIQQVTTELLVLVSIVTFQKLPSALMLAADCDSAACVTLLLDHCANVNDVDGDGYNALCRAIVNGKK